MSATKALADERLARIMDPEPCDVTSLGEWFQMTQSELALALGRSPRTIARWKAVQAVAPTRASAELAQAVRKMGRVRFLLGDLMPYEVALRWMQTPNPGFRGEAPIDILMSGRVDEVIAILEALADGGTF